MTTVQTTASPKIQTVRQGPSWSRRLVGYEEFGLGLLLIIVVVFFMITVPTAREARVYFDLLREVSPNLIAVAGMTLLVVAGGLDISLGSMLAFPGGVTVANLKATGQLWGGIPAGLPYGHPIGPSQ